MDKENEIKHYQWNGPELRAELYGDVKLPDGGQLYRALVGHVSILPGDYIHVTHGANLGISTRSGKGYVNEFPHGKLILSGLANLSASLLLEPSQTQQYELITSTKEEYEAQLKKQRARIEPQFSQLLDMFIFTEMEKRNKLKLAKEEKERKNKEMVDNAVKKMGEFFGNKPKKP